MERVEFDPNGGCWLWSGSLDVGGYGLIGGNGVHNIKVHRLSYSVNVGPIPDGLFVLHKCDVRACCNPDHLFVGTKQDNALDAVRKGRWVDNAGEKHGLAKLADADVLAIRQALEAGERQASIAQRFRIHQTTICNIKTGKRRAKNV
jgi:hypothetical protein